MKHGVVSQIHELVSEGSKALFGIIAALPMGN
jgi:hypothetical protein